MIKNKIEANIAQLHLLELVDGKWYSNKYRRSKTNSFEIIDDLDDLLPENKVFFKKITKPKDINKAIERAMVYWLENSDYKADLKMIRKLLSTKRKRVIQHLIDNYDINDRLMYKNGNEKDSIAIFCLKNNIYSEEILQRKDFDLKTYKEEAVFSVISQTVFNSQRVKELKYLINDLPVFFEKTKINTCAEKNGITIFTKDFFMHNFLKQDWSEAFTFLKREQLSNDKNPDELLRIEACCVFIDFLTKNNILLSEDNSYNLKLLKSFNQELIEYGDFNEKNIMKKDLDNIKSEKALIKRRINKF